MIVAGDRARVAVIGGGVWLPPLASALSDLPVDLRVAARRPERLARVVAATPGPVAAFGSVAEAVEGADVVLLLVRVGGYAARSWDERFPHRHGRVGDEGLDLGGLANAWRTLPTLIAIAREIRRGAPRARVLDLVAPLGITTRALQEEGLDTVGLCELPAVTARALGEDPRRPDLHYAGYNHAGWFWPASAHGTLRLSEGVGRGLIEPLTLAEHGGAPLSYHYDVADPESGVRLGRLPRRPGRADRLAAESEDLLARWDRGVAARAARPTPWFDDAVAPALTALLGGAAWEGFANLGVPVPWLPEGPVVELRARWTSAGPAPVVPPAPPGPILRRLHRQATWEESGFRAAARRDPRALLPALEALGLEGDPAPVLADLLAPVEVP